MIYYLILGQYSPDGRGDCRHCNEFPSHELTTAEEGATSEDQCVPWKDLYG